MLPRIAITDADDANLLFDVVNTALTTENDPETRDRLAVLLINIHTERVRLRAETV